MWTIRPPSRSPSSAICLGRGRSPMTSRSIVLADPIDARARLQLARALALSGDAMKAKSAYADLLTLWRNGDPDIPVLREARAESARLP
jgi:eukaryotic-like serine/threonine-protein kinase